MRIIPAIPFVLPLVLAVQANQTHTSTVASVQEHSAPDTTATSLVTERIVHRSPAHVLVVLKRKHPHVFLEVIKIREQVLVDKHNLKELSREAVASEQLFRVHHNGRRTPLRSRLYLLSPNRGQRQAVAAQRDPEELDWFDKLALALHLDRFWPRFLFSLCAGFLMVASGLAAVQLVCHLVGYEGKSEEDEYAALLNPNTRRPEVINASNIQQSAIMQESII